MINFLQQFFLNPYLIILILLGLFVLISFWAIRIRKELVGYGLGWLIGIFGLVIYGVLVGEPSDATQVSEGVVEHSMNLLEVTMPSLLGILSGAWILQKIVVSEKKTEWRPVVVTILTTATFWLIVFLAVAAPYINTQRMIGLFTWAFGIGALMMLAVMRQKEIQKQQNQKSKPNNPDPQIRNLNQPQKPNVPHAKIDEQKTPRRFGDHQNR